MTNYYGEITNPMTLADAIAPWSRILPGHTVWLRGGVYSGDYVSNLQGTEAAPILIKAYPGERVIVDGSLTINGAHTRWYGIEKRLSGGVRWTDDGAAPDVTGELTITGSGTKLINWIIHNQSYNGIGWWSPANGGELYGCVIFDNGWNSPDRGHGHSIYTQNLSTNAKKVMKHCILAQQFGMDDSNLALYGTGATGLQHYELIDNVIIGGRCLIGGDAPIDDITVNGVHFYGSVFMLGWHDDGHISTDITNARIYGRFAPLYMRSYSFQNSLVVQATANEEVVYLQEPAAGFTEYVSDDNAYHNTGGHEEPFQVETVDWYTFEAWKARYGFDTNSTYSTSLPAANSTHVYPNEYDEDRGMVVVWNWQGLDSVSVDVSDVLAAGDSYRLRQATNYFGDVATGTVALDGTITIDMQAASHSVSTPDGWETPLIDTTFPTFGCFVIEAA